MSKARDLANAGTALGAVTATELGYVDGVTSAIQTQIDTKEATLPSQTGNSGKYLTTNGSAKSWGTVSQYALPTQTGNSGKYLTTNGTAESWGTVATPITWTGRFGGVGDQPNRIAYNGTDLFVAMGNNGLCFTSPDGITWTVRTSSFGSSDIYDVAYGNGLWVATGSAGKIATSTDGTTWTQRTSNMATSELYAVAYANSLWVAVGSGGGTTNTGGIAYSTDGITWTRKSQTLTVGQLYRSVVWNGTNWIVGASLSTNNYLYASTPSGTWTVGHTGSNSTVWNIFWDGTRHITQEGTNWRYSTSLTLGTTTYNYGATNETPSKRSVLYSGKIWFIPNNYTPYYITSFTPSSATYPIPGTIIDNPTSINGDSAAALWVGAQGVLISNTSGVIWATF